MNRRRRRERETHDIARRFDRLLVHVSPLGPGRSLLEIEDRRDFHPMRDLRPALTFSGKPTRLVAADRKASPQQRRLGIAARSQTKAAIRFEDPRRVLICVRRKMRKEVLHAFRKAGRGGAKQRKRRRNEYSEISC